MSGHDTLHKDGGWTVELITPLPGGVTHVHFKPLSFDTVIRFQKGAFVSTLGLMAEITGVRESALRMIQVGQDMDRVMRAFTSILPANIANAVNSEWPLATPEDALPPEQKYEVADQPDAHDPRFPRVEGKVKRFAENPKVEPAQPTEALGLDLSMPKVMTGG